MGVGSEAGALAGAARSAGQLYHANIPTALVSQLEAVGLATRSVTSMGGVIGTEIRFSAAASKWIVPFFL